MNVIAGHSCERELRSAQLKVTPTRLAVLKFLESTDKPIDVATIINFLKKTRIEVDQATVFRIINLFTGKGLTQKLQLNEGKFRYEISSKPDHHHLICKNCGDIQDISDCSIDKLVGEIEKKKGFKVKSHYLEFFGVCRKCQF